MDGSTDFHRGWEEYVAGFGDLHGEYWLGERKIPHSVTIAVRSQAEIWYSTVTTQIIAGPWSLFCLNF